MKILAVSDRVVDMLYSPAVVQQFSDVDLVLSCGDLPARYLEYIQTMLNVPLLYVFGNHDHGIHTSDGGFELEPRGCLNIDSQVIHIKGLLIAGLQGSMYYSDRASYQYTEEEMRKKALLMTPALWWNRLRHGRFLDILVTHAPPYRIHDGTDRCHTGFKTFLWFIETFRPRYLIHGHMHVYGTGTAISTRYRQTQVINAYNYQVIEIATEEDVARGVGDV